MTKRLRWVVVGYGAFGERHVATLLAAEQEVAAVVDPDPVRRASAAETVGAAAVGSLVEALELEPDGVVVATPEHLHRDAVVRSLAVSHVLVEKPIATNVEDALAMVGARGDDRQLFVGHLLRFDPRLVTLQRLVADGELGEIVHLTCRRIGLRSLAETYQRVQPLLLSGVHDADVVAWMTGARCMSTSARSVWRWGLDAPEHQVALLELSDGATATIEAGWVLPDGAATTPYVAIEVRGASASASIVNDGPLMVTDSSGVCELSSGAPSSVSPEAMLAAQLDHVLQCISAGIPSPSIGPDPAIDAVRTMQAAAESAAAGGERVLVAS